MGIWHIAKLDLSNELFIFIFVYFSFIHFIDVIMNGVTDCDCDYDALRLFQAKNFFWLIRKLRQLN